MDYKYLANKRVLIGITGGIAAYKTLELIRRLKEHGAQVKVVLTANGKEFVTELSVNALTADNEPETAMSHIALARWAEVILVAPASANFIAKFTHGLADDLLSTICLAATAPILVAPAMNQQMWQNVATQDNIKRLHERQCKILGPATGNQACGENGPGRMLEPAQLLQAIHDFFAPKFLNNKHILITAGPTQEAIDPVRYISNHSSGKMGYALAAAALQLGAHVTLISGPTALTLPTNDHLEIISTTSAQSMLQAVMQIINHKKIDIFIGCAAVADYAPIAVNPQKIKKDAEHITLELKRTPDILAQVAALPADSRPFTIGFAAETENLFDNAAQKLQQKCLDLIIANSVDGNKGFNQDDNQVWILGKNTAPIAIPKMRKESLAYEIFAALELE